MEKINKIVARLGFKRMGHSPGKWMDGERPRIGITHDSKVPYPGLTGVNIHAFTLLRGVLRHRQPRPEPHRLQNEQSPFTRSDTGHPDLLDVGRSYGSITDTFHSRAAPRGELRQSHTCTVTGTIRSPS